MPYSRCFAAAKRKRELKCSTSPGLFFPESTQPKDNSITLKVEPEKETLSVTRINQIRFIKKPFKIAKRKSSTKYNKTNFDKYMLRMQNSTNLKDNFANAQKIGAKLQSELNKSKKGRKLHLGIPKPLMRETPTGQLAPAISTPNQNSCLDSQIMNSSNITNL
ncbi:unnamed protein product [Moneuplotes crassus]|uniref:Uncharacterized protein n=1 Tax=Euplotes crassus TaxID=5936 RepID=A0AAD1XAI0_EUPCR|nr:unnamed protein product [Moneuplotes crassus]